MSRLALGKALSRRRAGVQTEGLLASRATTYFLGAWAPGTGGNWASLLLRTP
jgi:hypothetical protein